jgi:hypothetical protein
MIVTLELLLREQSQRGLCATRHLSCNRSRMNRIMRRTGRFRPVLILAQCGRTERLVNALRRTDQNR